jgi:hypothetical protein
MIPSRKPQNAVAPVRTIWARRFFVFGTSASWISVIRWDVD